MDFKRELVAITIFPQARVAFYGKTHLIRDDYDSSASSVTL